MPLALAEALAERLTRPPLRRPGSGAAVDLARRLGNQAFTGLVATVQRHEGPTTEAEAEAGAAEQAQGSDGTAVVEAAKEAESGAQPAPGTGTTGTAGTKLTGAARKKAIEDVLRASATGMWVMGVLEKWDIPVDYEFSGTGSFHRGGEIFVNKNKGIGAAAITMMHEAQHADTFKSGKQADKTTLSRDEFVKQMIADEAEAVVRQIEGLAVTKSLGVDMTNASVGDALKERYLKAFYKKGAELRAANPKITTAAVNRICRQATRDGEVTSWFHDGTFTTSTDGNSYADFYGKQWDDANKATK